MEINIHCLYVEICFSYWCPYFLSVFSGWVFEIITMQDILRKPSLILLISSNMVKWYHEMVFLGKS